MNKVYLWSFRPIKFFDLTNALARILMRYDNIDHEGHCSTFFNIFEKYILLLTFLNRAQIFNDIYTLTKQK